MKDMILEMLETQDKLNNEFVGSDWKDRNLNWLRYARVEAYELMEHYGTFKHWKKPSTDLAQARIEMVDIWHFLLAKTIETIYQNGGTLEEVLDDLVSCIEDSNEVDPTEDGVEDINMMIDIFDSTTHDSDDMYDIIHAAIGIHYFLDIDMEWIAAHYFGKVALNRLRINYGQQEGNYIKNWGVDKLEDNVFLEQLFEEGIAPDPHLIYARLEEKYRQENNIGNH